MKYFLIAFSILVLSCQTSNMDKSDPYEKIEDKDARALLQKAVEKAGGLEKWEKKKSIAFQ
ncbi:MAG: hypothetical protein AAF599_04270, partial [Bacteroidota bacterium]